MRKATYYIDDIATMRRIYSDYDTDSLFAGMKPFKAIYTLYSGSCNNSPDRYELVIDGKKANINDLNGYERGVVLADCKRHFEGSKPQYNEVYMFERVEEVQL